MLLEGLFQRRYGLVFGTNRQARDPEYGRLSRRHVVQYGRLEALEQEGGLILF